MLFDEVWSYPIDRINEYFQNCGAVINGSACLLDEVQIQLFALENKTIGPISLPQTRVVIEGDRAEVIYHAFYLHFLSGGA